MKTKLSNPFLLSSSNRIQKSLLIFLLIVSIKSFSQTSSGFTVTYSSPEGIGRFQGHNHVNLGDNTTVILGECTKTYDEVSNIFLMKVDAVGQVLWAKQISPANKVDNFKICAMKDGSIVVAENYVANDTPIGAAVTLFKFTCSGQLVWSKVVSLGTPLTNSNRNYALNNMSEGAPGDILLSLLNYNTGDAIIGRLDANANLVWSKTFIGDASYKHNAQSFYVNNKVVVVGLKPLKMYPAYTKYFFAMRLNYANGSIELKKDYYGQEFPTGNFGLTLSTPNIHFNASLLADNKIAMGGLFYNFTPSDFYMYNLILDGDLSVVKSTAFHCPMDPDHGAAGYHKTLFFPNGDINIIGYNPYGPQQINWYTADQQYTIKKQITVAYVADAIDMDFTVAQHGVDGYSFLSSYFDYGGSAQRNVSFAVAKDNDQRIKNCLGRDSAFATLRSWSLNSNSWNWNSVKDNQLAVAAYPAVISDITVNAEFICNPSGPVLTNDYLKIKGDSTICSLSRNSMYTASSNFSGHVIWSLSDSSAYQSADIINDSTIRFIFRHPDAGTTSFKLYATTGDCKTLIDSITITIYPGNHDLPNNLTICNDSFRLQPGNWFESYRWQDGTTDSFYIVNRPGTYIVELTDACGTLIRDTSIFMSKVSGKHYTKSMCTGDSSILEAPSGLTGYRWSPDVNLYHISDSIVKSFTTTNTTYYLSATTQEGCVYADTNTVVVKTAPYLNLGRDASICFGNTIKLTGGVGFVKYLWNTGDLTPDYQVSSPGTYSLTAEDQNGCFAKDSITVTFNECPIANNSINVPSAFSPNNDGINDVFKPVIGGDIVSYEFAVYNRWGQLIFKSNQLGKGWDGNFNGIPQIVDTYIWTCSYKFRNNSKKFERGPVTLIR